MVTWVCIFKIFLHFVNAILSVNNFVNAENVEFSPSSASEYAESIALFFPAEIGLNLICILFDVIYWMWFQMIFVIPILLYNLKLYFEKKHAAYVSIGEKLDYKKQVWHYQLKMMFYLFMILLSFLKLLFHVIGSLSTKFISETSSLYWLVDLLATA